MIFLIYTAESIGLTFFITTGTFGASPVDLPRMPLL
jgi:FtsH-binding integral membrane protein